MTCVDHAAYMRPKPEAVARLVASHGLEAAASRWHWMDERTLCSIARSGRAALGEAPVKRRTRSFTDEDTAVVIEASYVLGSTTRGERAAGLYHNGGRGCFEERGLDYVRVSSEERGRSARIGHAANRGDAAAAAERDAMHAYELAVGRVLRAAFRLVPTQPETGRYVLPPLDDALRIALAGEDPTAIAAVFPDLGLPPAVPIESPAAEPEAETVSETVLATETVQPSEDGELEPAGAPVRKVSRGRRRLPDDEAIRRDHAEGAPASELARYYGITVNGLYQAWRRLGLPAGGRARKPKRRDPLPIPQALPVDVGTELVVYTELPPGRLPLVDLALAVTLARDTGLSRDEAIAWVRADIAASGRA